MVTLLTMRLGDLLFFILLSSFMAHSYFGGRVFELKGVEVLWLVVLAFTKSAQLPFSG